MFQLADPNNISAVVKAGYRGIQLPTHISPAKHFYFISDWVKDQTRGLCLFCPETRSVQQGQKSIGSFGAKMHQDYFEYTHNLTFLRERAYPLAKLNADFYMSYFTREAAHKQRCDGGCYNLMHSCAMEHCGSQGNSPHGDNITVSNNPPFDLAFAKRTLRFVLKGSALLNVDHELRDAWRHALENIAPYPHSKEPSTGRDVLAQATLNTGPTSNDTDGFPNITGCKYHGPGQVVGQCYNARYPASAREFLASLPHLTLERVAADLLLQLDAPGRRHRSQLGDHRQQHVRRCAFHGRHHQRHQRLRANQFALHGLGAFGAGGLVDSIPARQV